MTDLLFTSSHTALREHAKNGTPDQKAFLDVQKVIGTRTTPIDRSETVVAPYKFKSLFPLPDLSTYTNDKSFSDVVDQRAIELHEYSRKLNCPLLVLYSGGIDSTTVLSALIKNAPNNDTSNICVCLNTYSVRENPEFYYKHILKKLKIVSSNHLHQYTNDDYILVTGEGSDQLLGTDIFLKVKSKFEDNHLDLKWSRETIVPIFLALGIDELASNVWFSVISDQINTSKYCEISNVRDFLWWYNFCYKWQNVYFRVFLTAYKDNTINTSWLDTRYRNFYMSKDLQCWSILNPDAKWYNDVHNYKMPAKQYIYDFDRNEKYYNFKIKVASLQNLIDQSAHQGAIDSDYNFLKPYFDIEPYINTENSFKDAIAEYKS